MSIAGGYYLAVERAYQAGCDCVQLFTKNNNQWRAKPMDKEDVERFQEALSKYAISSPLSHSSYLINVASPDPDLWRRSVEALAEELRRAEALGIFGVVLHPGAAMGATESAAIARVVRGLNQAIRETKRHDVLCLLETTAGQGSCLGHRFEQLARILDKVARPERFAVCVDTCHLFAAGHSLATWDQYQATMSELDRQIGIDRIRAFHLNDSKAMFGSRVDRHEHIGRGQLGIAPFRFLLNDERFRSVPMYLETPKGEEHGRDLDRINLARLRRLVKRAG